MPLLGVLPGTGGLTRVTDKRQVRHDLADLFCTSVEGVRGQKAKDWRLVDDIAKPAEFAQKVQERALQLAAQSDRPADAQGRRADAAAAHDRGRRAALSDMSRSRSTAPSAPRPSPCRRPPARSRPTSPRIEAAGAAWYPLALARELDDAILEMRTNELDIGTWLIKTEGDAAAVLAMDATLLAHKDHWLVRETIGLLRRTFSRLDVSSRSLFALIEPGSCFAGTLPRAGAGLRPQLPPGAARRRRHARRRSACREANFGLLPDGHRPERACSAASTTSSRRSTRCAPRSASRSTPTPRSRSAW